MTFHVGQRVVCIEGHWDIHSLPPGARPFCLHMPRNGAIYTVRENLAGWLHLVEIRNPPSPYGEVLFRADCFRPIVERKTDISVFRQLLNPTPQKVDA